MRSVLIASSALAAMIVPGQVEAMSEYQWKSRPFLVFAPAPSNLALAAQHNELNANRAGCAQRDMVLIYVVGDAVAAELGPAPKLSAATLRARYGVARDAFKAVLVGKDGGTKLTSATAITATDLFATIDAMPMRAEEMRR